MGFKLNIGKDGGGGSTGFSLSQSLNMIKAKGMSSQMIGTDVMKDGYYNTVNESGAGSPSNFNKGLKQASADGKLTGEFKELVDASEVSGVNKNADSVMYQKSCFNVNDPDKDKDKVDDGNVKVTKDKISGQGSNVEVTIPAGSTSMTKGEGNEVIMTKNLKDKKEIRTNYSRGGQERSMENSNYNARNVMTPKQKKKMDEDERSGKGPTMMYGSKKKK
jgi:hypothetical protein